MIQWIASIVNSYRSILLLAGICLCSIHVHSSNENRPLVQVTHEAAVWKLTGSRLQVSLDEKTFRMEIRTPSGVWETVESSTGELQIKSGTETFLLSLKDAGTQTIEPYWNGYQSGIKIVLSRFASPSNKERYFGVGLQLFIGLQGKEEDLMCEAVPEEGDDAILHLHWPKEFKPETCDFTVVPFMQGMLLPRDWPRAVRLYDTECYGRGLYMPWWGYQKENAAAVTILDTPEDGGCHFSHPEGGPTRLGVRWNHSLGRMAYPRRARLCFLDGEDYNGMAKRYRRHVMENGHFVSMKEKIARSPLVEKLLGSPVVHTNILYHIQPQSSYYDKEKSENNHQLVTFDERAGHLQALSGRGVRRAYVHLDGWGQRGYDNLHPDLLPPYPEAGGWEGMKRFAEVCDRLNFTFAIHDQYRDFYHDAESYDPRHTILEYGGGRPFGNTWFGGNQSILCSRLAPGYVERNHRALIDHGVKVQGAYLDVFAVVPPDECYNPEHPVTRRDCLRYRGDCFDIVRRLLGIVSSEEPADWAIPHLDLVHHGPYPLDLNPGKGPAMGIPIPLFNLVYHDALFLPWSLGKGEWGIPETDWGYLHALLNAGLPYMSIEPDEESLKTIKTLCALHERVGLQEMIRHEFLDPERRRQRTIYADGTTVTADFEKNEYRIEPPLDGNPSAFKEM